MTSEEHDDSPSGPVGGDNFLCTGHARNTTRWGLAHVDVGHRCRKWDSKVGGYTTLWEDVTKLALLAAGETREVFSVRTTTGSEPDIRDEWWFDFDLEGKRYSSDLVRCRLDKKQDANGNVILEIPTLTDFFVVRPGKDRVCKGKVKENRSPHPPTPPTKKMRVRGHIDLAFEF
ncbi:MULTISPECIES: hypothetical protein [Streptomyces]|uniref:hypothetical protein n=1 Tax=Streptomyces TaxID=1883 RepID=UPI0022487702|nr:hypothetical protein [Streptomyces sp. JHD 1]MCX2971267.1 hypothetical protein [Streptomyces sp. JHD 1]